MKLIIRFVRIYTPFICTLVALVSGMLFIREDISEEFIYLSSVATGNSLLIIAYLFATSLRMCIWYKLNLLCLMLVQLCGLAYYFTDMDFTLYVYVITLLSAMGIIFFLIFRIFYRVTSTVCSRRY